MYDVLYVEGSQKWCFQRASLPLFLWTVPVASGRDSAAVTPFLTEEKKHCSVRYDADIRAPEFFRTGSTPGCMTKSEMVS